MLCPFLDGKDCLENKCALYLSKEKVKSEISPNVKLSGCSLAVIAGEVCKISTGGLQVYPSH
jgi:hypothetical protein